MNNGKSTSIIDYTRSHVATESETNEIVQQATGFYEVVEGWIDSKFPTLKR